jgi:plasmid maintenance system antidote protein VapI
MTDLRKPTHPGEVLREDVVKPLGLTVTEAAKRLLFHIVLLGAQLSRN